MKNKIIKWVVSLALGLVLTLAVSAITLLATTPVSTTIFMVILDREVPRYQLHSQVIYLFSQ